MRAYMTGPIPLLPIHHARGGANLRTSYKRGGGTKLVTMTVASQPRSLPYAAGEACLNILKRLLHGVHSICCGRRRPVGNLMGAAVGYVKSANAHMVIAHAN